MFLHINKGAIQVFHKSSQRQIRVECHDYSVPDRQEISKVICKNITMDKDRFRTLSDVVLVCSSLQWILVIHLAGIAWRRCGPLSGTGSRLLHIVLKSYQSRDQNGWPFLRPPRGRYGVNFGPACSWPLWCPLPSRIPVKKSTARTIYVHASYTVTF